MAKQGVKGGIERLGVTPSVKPSPKFNQAAKQKDVYLGGGAYQSDGDVPKTDKKKGK